MEMNEGHGRMLSEGDIWTEIKRMKEAGYERWWDKGFQAKGKEAQPL